MTFQPNVSPLRQRMIDDMRMRQLSPKTQANYLRIVREFSRYLGRSPDTATVEDLRGYQLHLVDHGTSPVSLNSAITGLKFFFEITLHEPELMARMQPRPFKSWGGRFRLTALAYGMVSGSVLFVARCRPSDATAVHSPCREAAILSAKMRWDENSPFKTATLTCAMQCAPSSAQRICRFLAIR